MANFGGFLGALGQAFGGYAQDQQNRAQQAATAQKFALEQANANRENQLATAQIGNYQSEAAARAAQLAAKTERDRVMQQHGQNAIGGDPAAIAEVLRVAPELAGTLTKDQAPKWTVQETANGFVQVNPETGEVRPLQLSGKTLQPKPAAEPKDHWQSAGVDPGTGTPLLFNALTGETKQGGGIKGGGSAQGQAAQRAIQAASPVIPAMEEYENGVLSGKYTAPSSLKRGMAAAANTTSQSPMSQMIGGLAGSALSDNDQKYADYMRNSQIVGDAAAAAGGRFSNARVGLEGSLASMRQGDEKSASMIRTIQQRRRAMLNEASQRYGVQPEAPTASPSSAPYAKSVLDRFGIKPTTP